MTTTHNGRLEFALSDAALAPGQTGQRVNSGLVWMRLDGGPWKTTGHRSLHKAVKIAESLVDPEEAFAEMTSRNKTRIPGMSLQKNKSKTGAGVNYTWKVNWRENKHPKGRSFAFATFDGDGCQAFIAGALCRMDADLRVYGFSEIDPEEQNLKRLYREAMKAYGIE